ASLAGLGIETVGQLADAPEDLLRRRLGVASAAHLTALANGRDPRTVEIGRETKSVSVESTYAQDLRGSDAVERALLELCHRLSGRLLKAHLAGRTVTLKLRFGDFTTITRSATRDSAVSDTSQLWPLVNELLGKVVLAGQGVRLLGVGVSGLTEGEPTQMALDGSDRTALAEAASEVRERFGEDAVIPARLAEPPDEHMGV
ncbi:MAG: DNA polymerase IV, partial [bacterium]|nr:DNA polymerase IV [bacterium]